MSEMIQRVAKIIDPIAFGDYPDDAIDPRNGCTWANTRFSMRERARAAIAALREPSAGQIAAGWMNLPVAQDGTKREEDVERIYRSMIDAALQEPMP